MVKGLIFNIKSYEGTLFNISDVELKPEKPFFIALTYVFGLGITKAAYVCDLFGINRNIRTLNIGEYLWECVFDLVTNGYLTGYILKDFIRQRLVNMFRIGLIKAARIFAGQPARGQRTQTNSRTPERLRPAPIYGMMKTLVKPKTFMKNKSQKNVSKQKRK